MDEETRTFVDYWLDELADVIDEAATQAAYRARLQAMDTDRTPDA